MLVSGEYILHVVDIHPNNCAICNSSNERYNENNKVKYNNAGNAVIFLHTTALMKKILEPELNETK